MSTKRSRARNEQALRELLRVPGNDRCADCMAPNPGWASWNVSFLILKACFFLDEEWMFGLLESRLFSGLGLVMNSNGKLMIGKCGGDVKYRLEFFCVRDVRAFIASWGRIYRESSR